MNVYDFDKTIYDGDSSVDLIIFLLKKTKKYKEFLMCLINAIKDYKKNKNLTTFKEKIFYILKYIDNKENLIDEFWKINQKKIFPYYLKQHKDTDVIISASPYFSIKKICSMLNIKNVIASNVSIEDGKFFDENCKGEKKVLEFKKKFKNETIDEFYSDSDSDTPLAKISKKAYKVKKGKIYNWE